MDLEGVHYLRRVEDSDRLRDAIRTSGRIVVVGAGWIGLETAAAAPESGCDVTVIDPQPAPLLAALGSEMGEFFAALHLRNGVDLRLSHAVIGLRGTDHVTSVSTDGGGEFAADAVIVGIGAIPNIELAEQAGLSCDNGIVVDESLGTLDPDDGRVVAGMQVNLWDDGIAPVEELIRSRQPVDPDRLADTSVPLAAHLMA